MMADSKGTITTMPPEILMEIVGYLQTPTNLSLSLSCARFRQLCIKEIYREVELRNGVQALKCCEVLAYNDHAARSVRNFSVEFW